MSWSIKHLIVQAIAAVIVFVMALSLAFALFARHTLDLQKEKLTHTQSVFGIDLPPQTVKYEQIAALHNDLYYHELTLLNNTATQQTEDSEAVVKESMQEVLNLIASVRNNSISIPVFSLSFNERFYLEKMIVQAINESQPKTPTR